MSAQWTPPPSPVKIRVWELAREAGVRPRFAVNVLTDLGYTAKTSASSVELGGFEHEALVAVLGDQ